MLMAAKSRMLEAHVPTGIAVRRNKAKVSMLKGTSIQQVAETALLQTLHY
jgi:hypothetical protein